MQDGTNNFYLAKVVVRMENERKSLNTSVAQSSSSMTVAHYHYGPATKQGPWIGWDGVVMQIR